MTVIMKKTHLLVHDNESVNEYVAEKERKVRKTNYILTVTGE